MRNRLRKNETAQKSEIDFIDIWIGYDRFSSVKGIFLHVSGIGVRDYMDENQRGIRN